jgi:integrase
VLKRWYEHCGRPPADAPLVPDLGCPEDREARALRADLKAAGVTRELLFLRSGAVERLRFHDLRATFVTWARRAGKGHGWIADRTGHLTEEIMRRYDRGARMLADLKYVPFPDLSDVLPELCKDPSNVVRLRGGRG